MKKDDVNAYILLEKKGYISKREMKTSIIVRKRSPLRIILLRLLLFLILINIITILFALFDNDAGERDIAFVKRIIDGDTLIIIIRGVEESVRLIGVDAPESNHPLKPVQFFSRESMQFLERLAAGKNVFLEYDQQKRDKYERLLAYVFLEDGRLLNAEIIKEGFGFAYLKYPFQRMEEFKVYEEKARRGEKGLWKNQGMDEFQWLVSLNGKPFKVYVMAGALWAVEYDGFIKLRLSRDNLLSELSNLRLWIHEYHENDLKEVLLEHGWIEIVQRK